MNRKYTKFFLIGTAQGAVSLSCGSATSVANQQDAEKVDVLIKIGVKSKTAR